MVTSFEFKLHPVGPELVSGLIVHPFARARELLAGYRKVAAAAPDELTVWVVLRKAPPLPFLPAEVHGKEILVFAVCYAGEPGKAEGALAPLRALGEPIADVIGVQPYVGLADGFRSRCSRRGRSTTGSRTISWLSATDCSTRWSILSGRCRQRNARSSSLSSAAPAVALPPMRPPIRIATPIS